MMHGSELFFAAFLVPVVAVVAWWIRKVNREVTTAQRLALPFQPQPLPSAPLPLLRSLDAAEQLYLHRQLRAACWIMIFGAWLCTFMLVLPAVFEPNETLWTNHAALVWFQFLRNSSNTSQFLSMALVGCVLLVVTPLRFSAEARFYRTRPLPLGFLFWTRVLTVLPAVLLAAALGIGLSLGLLRALDGPVWRDLPAHIPRVLGPDDADLVRDYANLLATSAPRVFLSILTTVLLFFSSVVALATVPLLRGRKAGSSQVATTPLKLFLFVAIFPLGIAFTHFLSFRGFAVLFIYVNLGPPPPYAYALVPVALSAVCLGLARVFIKHLEV